MPPLLFQRIIGLLFSWCLLLSAPAFAEPAGQTTKDGFSTALDPEFTRSDLSYTGPKASLVSITESPFWAINDDDFIRLIKKRGWTLVGITRSETPYGLGPKTMEWKTPKGRSVLFIRDYGKTPGGEYRQRQLYERLYWQLWKAGAKVMIVGSHLGSADWRAPDVRVKPGDLIFPWSFESKGWFTGLPGTEFETVWNNPKVTRSRELPWPYMNEPFSRPLWTQFRPLVEAHKQRGELVGKIYEPEDVRGVLVSEDSIAFETNYDIFARMALSKTISEMHPNKPPVITLHGSVVNPVLAKFLSIDVLPYQIISNPAQGIEHDISDTHDAHVFDRAAAEMWLDLELQFFEKVKLD